MNPDDYADTAGKASGFSLHAGVAARSDERKKLERLCRYISRPAVSERRLSLTSSGNIRYQLKTPYGDGTTHVIFEPLDFMARLAALVPKPRANLTRFHGVFAPNSKHRALITPAKRGKSTKRQINGDERSPVEQHAAMSWAQRAKRVFNIDISICEACGDQADTCTPGEKSGIERVHPITREQGAAPNRFVRITDEICLTQPIHQIAANKSSGR